MITGNDIKTYYQKTPKITKVWFTLSIVLPLAGLFGVIPDHRMNLLFLCNFHLDNNYLTIIPPNYHNWKLLFTDHHIWRAFTCAFYFPILTDFPIFPIVNFVHYLLALRLMFTYSCNLELGVFRERPGAYVRFLLFSWVSSVLLALALFQKWVFDALIYAVLNLYCIIRKDRIFYFWPDFECTAAKFPWVLLTIQVILEWKIAGGLIGISVSNLYYKLNKKSLLC